MPRIEDYYAFECATPEPRLIPGYTGYLPGYGPKRIYQMGDTYGRMTHNIMSTHHIAGLRLRPILDSSDLVAKEDDNQFQTWKHECTAKDVKLRNFMVSGYTGYIPRKIFSIGKGLNTTTQESVGQFVRLQEKKFEYDNSPRYLENILLEWKVAEKIPRLKKEEILPYAGYLNVSNYLRNPMMDISMENKYKDFEPGQFNKRIDGSTYPEILPRYLRGFEVKNFLPREI